MRRCRGLLAVTAGIVAMLSVAITTASRAAASDEPVHLGVASCAGNNCHGAVEPAKTSRVAQDEYLIWQRKDKHSKAFTVLREERGRRIANNLGLPDAENAKLCLDCHADNVAATRRGRQFQLADGVGCESCHGGAGGWLGIHIAGGDHKTNVAAGLYPMDEPLARAERCLSCHLGDDKRIARHELMGAGHPPLGFELDTYTELQPAHYRVDADYVERKGEPNHIRVWAVGLVVDVRTRMAALLDPKNAPKGLQPELALFDCHGCHHGMDQLQWRQQGAAGLPPGHLRFYDATAILLRIVAGRLAPELGDRLGTQLSVLQRATQRDWAAVQRAAAELRQTSDDLLPLLVRYPLDQKDALALARAVIHAGASGEAASYSAAQQLTMALASITAGIHAIGIATDKEVAGLNEALGELYVATSSGQTYRPETFVPALNRFEARLPAAAPAGGVQSGAVKPE
jgi:hypothetical protein